MSKARCTLGMWGVTVGTGSRASISLSHSISCFCTSSGRSMRTGPGRPDRAMRKASRKIHGACSALCTWTAHFVTGLAISTMSTAWNASSCSFVDTAWPVMHRIGTESACAVYRPVIMFVPAGPDVPIATPTLPVVRDQPSAMCVAPSSCRTMRCRISLSRIAWYSGRIAAPGQPKVASTPSDSRMSTMARMTGIRGMADAFLGCAATYRRALR